ncbi:hypothetical protein ACHAXS_008679 [Conticribra weissflogii]
MTLGLSSSMTTIVSILTCLLHTGNNRLSRFPQVSQARSSITGPRSSRFPSAAHGSLVRGANEGNHDTAAPKRLITDDQLKDYVRDGYIVLSGLLEADEMNALIDAGTNIVSAHIEKLGGKELPKGNFQVHEYGLVLDDKEASGEGSKNVFRRVALHSKLPQIAAELMQLDKSTENLRLLRDVFLAKGPGSTSSCGWHVDDQMFWPASYQLPNHSTVDQSGINAWIALDDMPLENGGSLAVAPASHGDSVSWRNDAYAALGFDDSFGDGISKDELFKVIKSGKVDTCGLERMAPEIHQQIEKTKTEFNFKRGDIIFMNRWLFHRSTDVTEKGKAAVKAIEEIALLKRYSLRYVTGSSSLPSGFMTELSILGTSGANSGKEFNEVDGEWYPQCWPEVDDDVEEKIEHVVKNFIPVAQEQLAVIMTEVMALFRSR